MSRLVKGAPSPQKEQPDQKKIYMDWANHYLRKAHYSDTLSDLHECVQGDYLPKIIHAVVQSSVPGITVSPATDEERTHNIKNCVRHLEATGVNCSSFSVSDLSDGNMKAILSLFYSLSQFKRTTKSAPSEVPVSRIARPVSPSVKSSHGVSAGTPPQTTTNGIAGGAGMGGATKSMISPVTNRRTAGSSIMTSTVDKPYGARRMMPYKNLVLSGEKPAALELNGDGEGEQEGESGTSARKLQGNLPATGSTSRLDHLSTKSGIPGSKGLSHTEHGGLTSVSQPNLHRIPGRSKSESRLGHKDVRKDSATTDPGETPGKSSGQPKRMLKQPSASILSGRTTPVEHNPSGRTTPSKLMRPGSRLTKPSGGTSGEQKIAGKETPHDESETEPLKFERKRSNSEVRRPSAATNTLRSASKSAGETRGIPLLGGLAFGGKGQQKSSPVSPDSRLVSPGSVPSGDSSLRQLKPPSDIERSSTSTEPSNTTTRSDAAKRIGGGGLQAPTQRTMRTQSPSPSPSSSLKRNASTTPSEEGEANSISPSTDSSTGGREKGELSGKERPSSVTPKKLSKATSLQQFRSGIPSAGEIRKSPLPSSGLSKLQSLTSSQGFVPTAARGGSRSPRGDSTGKERAVKGGGRKERHSSNSSLESSTNSEHEIRPATSAHLEKQASSTGSSTQTESEKPNPAPPTSQNLSLITPLAGGKDNRRISPEGMSPDGKTLSNESINENQKNSMNRQDITSKFIEEVVQTKEDDGDVLKVRDKGDMTDKMGGTLEVGESETQTLNLSQGSEVATDSALSSLSLASASSPPHNSHSSLLTSSTDVCGQQPETGQAPYSVATSPHEKRSSSPHQMSHDSHVTVNEGGTPIESQGPPEPHHYIPAHMHPTQQQNHPLRSPLKKEKAKRARSLSPKSSRRIFPVPPQQPSGPAVNVSHYDAGASNGHVIPPPSTSERLAHLELSRTDSPESVKSDVASAYSSSRKPLRSSLRTAKDKDSSSSSLDSGKVNMPGTKVTISPRSSQVVFLPDEAGLHHSATSSQPTILKSPNKRTTKGRPSSLSDSHRVNPDADKRCSIASEKLDYTDEVNFLSNKLGHDPSHQRFDSTPELLQTFENELSTMKKDLANKDRMLSMYENSMADLSSKVHHLKKTLEEKDQEIKHLTEEKQSLFDMDGRSLASRMGTMDTGVLSDGCLSDSAMEPGHLRHKGDEKKKKKWKRWSFRKKAKDPHDLSSTLDAESMISGRSGRSLSTIRRQPSKSKSDLMSITEYGADMRVRDDAKSYMTEYTSNMPPPMMYSNDDIITVYEDPTPGAKAPVTLLPGYSSYYSRFGAGEGEGGEEGEGTVVLGTISIAPEISWITMDSKICDVFMHHINSLDGEGNLSLTEDSILHYFIADQRREIGNALLPPLTPYQSLASGTTVKIVLKGALQGSCDALAYKVLINTETLQSYVSLLMETQWLVVMGTKGTCKTSLATGLSRHLMQIVSEDGEDEGGEVVTINYNIEKEGLEKVLQDIREKLSRKIRMWPRPPILVVDNIYECSVLEQILTAAGNLPRRPYIIATLCTATMQGVPLHQLLFHHQMRVVTCNPQAEPVFGILSRSLRKQVYKLKAARIEVDPVMERLLQWLPYLLEHLDAFINRFHTQTVSLGPRVFMDCAVDQNRNELETWFINLWNHFVIPYLMGAIMAGIETYTADPQLEWVDVREFVVETYPWQPSVNVMKLRTLNPDDVGWNHAVRPVQNRFMLFKDDMKLPDDTRSLLSRIKAE